MMSSSPLPSTPLAINGAVSAQRCCQLYQPGLMPYRSAWSWQRSLVEQRRQQPELEDVLILLEHPPVYTLGQGASLEFLNFDPSETAVEVCRIERGGEVTYHCPGQLIGYPILNLRYYRQDLHWYLRQLEEVLIQVLAIYGVQGERQPGWTGVWVAGRKLGAIGIKVSRWVTMHGFALYVNPSLQGFEQIVPCGIRDKPVGSLVDFVPEIDLQQVRDQVAIAFSEVFGVRLIYPSESAISSLRTDNSASR